MFNLATVSEVTENGVKVIFDGESTASQKYFTRLESCACVQGDRVILAQLSGSYVVLGVLVR